MIPTKTPPGVEQRKTIAPLLLVLGVIPTKTPPGVEQFLLTYAVPTIVGDPDQDAPGR